MKTTNSMMAFGSGAATAYLFDPVLGHRRRCLLRDKLTSAGCRADDAIYKAGRDLFHRVWGLGVEMTSLFTKREPVSPNVLEARVRSKLGRYISHPHAIRVTASDGRIQLSGPILAHEVKDLLKCIRRVRGVTAVENQLEVHKQAQDIPALQGGAGRPGERIELAQRNWAPGTRLLADLAGGWVLFSGLRRGGILGTLGALGGIALLGRGLSNLPVKQLSGLGAGRRAIDIRKTIHVNAPPEEVFAFWRHFPNFSKFMIHVEEIRDLGDGRSHWVVRGPAGFKSEFNAVLTQNIPNQLLAWRTEPGSRIEHAGIIRFDPDPNGGTRIDIRMCYNPVAGAIGHMIAALFGQDPKHAMDEDLLRLKSLVEHGKASGHGKHARREEVNI